jgi:predicted nuclease with TOPRIM domain
MILQKFPKMAGNMAGIMAGNSEKNEGNLAGINNEEENLGAYKVISTQMVNLLLKETKELNQEIGALKQENTQLKAENAQLQGKVEDLTNRLEKSA